MKFMPKISPKPTEKKAWKPSTASFSESRKESYDTGRIKSKSGKDQGEEPQLREIRGKAFATLDFETDPFKHGRFPRPFAVGFFDGACYQSKWGSASAVIKWAVGRVKRFSGVVYAHNGGKFDFLAYLLGRAHETVWGEPVLCIAGRIVRMRFGEAELRDSYAILPAPLRSYDKGEIDYAWLERNRRQRHRRAILDYLKRDVISLRALVGVFVEQHGFGPLTAASAGMRYAKSLNLKVETFNDNHDKRFRKFYFGGLVLARKPGLHTGRFCLYDIKSAYPYAMLHDHAGARDFDFSNSARDITPQSFVVVEGDAQAFLRRSKEGNVYGGSGRFHVTGWEYLEAIRTGQFQGKVIYVETPKKVISFKPYVEEFFQRKQEAEANGDKAGRLINKIMLNALYGKFAQRNDKFREYFIWPLSHPIPSGFDVDSIWDNFQVISKPSPHRGLYNVATAASITGFVRAMLMKAIHETDAYYCDTDSVIVDAGRKPSAISDSLGGWSLEAEGDQIAIAGKKLYSFRKLDGTFKMATKGCRLTPQQMLDLCQGKSIHYKSDAPCYSLLNSPFFVKRTITATAPVAA